MSRFRRLTDAEARTLTRAELLDRVEAEQAHWFRKRPMAEADAAAYREFSRIMLAYLDPAAVIQAAMDTLEGRGSDYWETRPCDDKAVTLPAALAMDDNQRAGLAYGLMLLAREAEAEPSPPTEPQADGPAYPDLGREAEVTRVFYPPEPEPERRDAANAAERARIATEREADAEAEAEPW
jgi:hypothetical protein